MKLVSLLSLSDINECDTDNGGCEYSCENTGGSYQCGCRPGYELNADRHTCRGIFRSMLP